MSSVAAAKEAVVVLKDLEVKVPFGPDLDKEDAPIAHTFKLQCTIHNTRSLNDLPENFSNPQRIRADILRATKLAHLLDEDRQVSPDRRLAAFLCHESILGLVTKPTEHLDLCIAYLRRVHFVAFYGGKRFRDESHLLAMSSSLAFRSKQYIAAADEPAYNMREMLLLDHVDEEDNINSNETEIMQDGGETADKEDREEPSAATTPGKPVATNTKIPVDKKIAPMIADVEKRIALKAKRKEDPSIGGTPDEIDADMILKAQEKTFDALVRSKCVFEPPEDKCRCCFKWCNKLFKASSFLVKHLKTKHDGFGAEELVKDAEECMRKRFEAEAIDARPLPPIEVETANGVELKSVRAILDKYSAAPPPPNLVTPQFTFQNDFRPARRPYDDRYNNNSHRNDHHRDRDHYQRDRDSFSNKKRRSDDFGDNRGYNNDRRVSLDGALPTSNHKRLSEDGASRWKNDDSNKPQPFSDRKMNTYMDVDAPKVGHLCF